MAEAHREEIAKLEALYAAHPEGRVFTHLAEAYRRAGELDRAREILEDGLRRHPDYSSAHVVLGRVLMDRDKTDGAIGAFRRVLELDRHNLVALRSLGDLAERAGDVAAAVGYYRDLVALDPTDDRLRLTVARLEQQIQEASGAAETAPTPVAGVAPADTLESMGSADTPADATGDGEAADTLLVPVISADDDDDATSLDALDFPTLTDGPGEEIEEEEVILEVEGLSLGWGDEVGADIEETQPATAPAVAADEPEEESTFVTAGWLTIDDGSTDSTTNEPTTGAGGVEGAVEEPEPSEEEPDWAFVEERAAAAWTGPSPEAGDDVADDTEVEILDVVLDFIDIDDDGEADGIVEIATVAETIELESVADDEEREEAPAASVPAGPEAGADAPTFVAAAPAEDDSLDVDTADTVVTATMAELYARQGFYDRAMAVYRQLLEQVPEDDRLRERLTEVELLARTAPASEEDSAEEWQSAVAGWTGEGGVAGDEETPYAWAEADAEDEDGPSAGDYFAALLAWRPAVRTLELPTGEAVGRAGTAPADDDVALETGAVEAAFEEWFGDAPADGAADGETDGEGDADLEMFRSWLQSLKK